MTRWRRLSPAGLGAVTVLELLGDPSQLEFVDETGSRASECLVENDAKRPGTFVVKAPEEMDFEVKAVRLHLDSSQRTGIDTVQLVATNGDYEWPTRAESTSR